MCEIDREILGRRIGFGSVLIVIVSVLWVAGFWIGAYEWAKAFVSQP